MLALLKKGGCRSSKNILIYIETQELEECSSRL
jgi:hypothetical protein